MLDCALPAFDPEIVAKGCCFASKSFEKRLFGVSEDRLCCFFCLSEVREGEARPTGLGSFLTISPALLLEALEAFSDIESVIPN